MSATSEKFADLAVRMSSGAVMAVVGIAAVWAGGIWFMILLTVICAALVWELVRMLGGGPRRAITMGLIAAGSFLAVRFLPEGVGLPFVLAPALAGIGLLERNRTLYIVFSALIVIACYGLAVQRVDFGFQWMLWLALVVIATDVFGYFAGRLLGGPKFWPQVSPKKTWSGTAAGWIAAAVVGVFFMGPGVGVEIIGISIAISMASQMGDIAESAMKRKMGVKDSSALIPGHGGVFDRFDGMLGASVFLLLIEQLVDFPPVPL
ncbi:phosphatidate cytidylyltransferase [Litoreibacter ponti]|uniref:Phosphatidate cytidylyltransferase n=1 Tax=Litoreibacter ponti TaxID=1510457 RepID=A0A2T6BIK3_9RHOB|nr:phosphatidate cytidylyltransferase [Litoreibacter ponti]PTX55884.1 phosphatidate cytidylyltransferase [Litoreibacter ponti]